MEAIMRSLLGEPGWAEVYIRIFPRHIGIVMVTNVMAMPPGFLMNGGVPREGFRGKLFSTGEFVINSVQDGMAYLHRLQLLMHPQRSHPAKKGEWLKAEVKQPPPEDFHTPRKSVQPADVADVFSAELGFRASADRINGFAESFEPLGTGRR